MPKRTDATAKPTAKPSRGPASDRRATKPTDTPAPTKAPTLQVVVSKPDAGIAQAERVDRERHREDAHDPGRDREGRHHSDQQPWVPRPPQRPQPIDGVRREGPEAEPPGRLVRGRVEFRA